MNMEHSRLRSSIQVLLFLVLSTSFVHRLQARASTFIRKISLVFGGRIQHNEHKDSELNSGTGLKPRIRAVSVEIPRKPFVLNSPSAIALSPHRSELGSGASSASGRTDSPVEHQPFHRKGQSHSVLEQPTSTNFPPGIVVTQHNSQSDLRTSSKEPTRETSESPSIPTAITPQLSLLSPSYSHKPDPSPILNGLTSPMAIGSSHASPAHIVSSPGSASTVTPAPDPPATQSVSNKSATQSHRTTPVDKEGQPLRLSPTIIHRVPPWPIMALPALPPSQSAIMASKSSPPSTSALNATSQAITHSAQAHRLGSPSPSTGRPSTNRLITMPALPMSGSQRPQVCTPSPSRSSHEGHDPARESYDDMSETDQWEGSSYRSERRSFDSVRTDGDWEDAETSWGRPSMDSIDEDRGWTPSPSVLANGSSSSSQMMLSLGASSSSLSASAESLMDMLNGTGTAEGSKLAPYNSSKLPATMNSSNLPSNTSSTSSNVVPATSSSLSAPSAWNMRGFTSLSEATLTAFGSSSSAAGFASASDSTVPPSPTSPSTPTVPPRAPFLNSDFDPHGFVHVASSSSGATFSTGLGVLTPAFGSASQAPGSEGSDARLPELGSGPDTGLVVSGAEGAHVQSSVEMGRFGSQQATSSAQNLRIFATPPATRPGTSSSIISNAETIRPRTSYRTRSSTETISPGTGSSPRTSTETAPSAFGSHIRSGTAVARRLPNIQTSCATGVLTQRPISTASSQPSSGDSGFVTADDGLGDGEMTGCNPMVGGRLRGSEAMEQEGLAAAADLRTSGSRDSGHVVENGVSSAREARPVEDRAMTGEVAIGASNLPGSGAGAGAQPSSTSAPGQTGTDVPSSVTDLAATLATASRLVPLTRTPLAPLDHSSHDVVSHETQDFNPIIRPEHADGSYPARIEGKKQFRRQPSRSMINLSTILADSPPYEGKETFDPTAMSKGKLKLHELLNTSTPNKTLQRRQSLPSMATQPPAYSVVRAHDEEGREPLPKYSNDVLLVAQMPRKVEFTKPGVISRDRKWRRVWCVLEGTRFAVYRVRGVKSVWEGVVGAGDETANRNEKPNSRTKEAEESQRAAGRRRKVEEERRALGERMPVNVQRESASSPVPSSRFSRSSSPMSPYASSSNLSSTPSSRRWRSPSVSSMNTAPERPDHSHLIKQYTLQNAESGLGTDYTKRKNVIRVRMEGEQFLLQAKDVEEVVEWIEVGCVNLFSLHDAFRLKFRVTRRVFRRLLISRWTLICG